MASTYALAPHSHSHSALFPTHSRSCPIACGQIYKEIAIALKANEWRLPGLVALAGKVAANGAEPMPLAFTVPNTYVPAAGPNPWKQLGDGKEGSVSRVAAVLAVIKKDDKVHRLLDKLSSSQWTEVGRALALRADAGRKPSSVRFSIKKGSVATERYAEA